MLDLSLGLMCALIGILILMWKCWDLQKQVDTLRKEVLLQCDINDRLLAVAHRPHSACPCGPED